MKLGLQRGRVSVVPDYPGWRESFKTEREALLADAQGLLLEVEHVGSTTVPGLPAKPIIDIVAGVSSRETIPVLAEILTTSRWIDLGDKGESGGHLFVKESEPEVRTHHLHVVVYGDLQWRSYLAFRDRLLDDESLKEQYAALKRDLLSTFVEDRSAYTKGKARFVRSVLEESSGG